MPFCPNCANQVAEQAVICPSCGQSLGGASVQAAGTPITMVAVASNGLATASLALGVVGLVLSFIPMIGFLGMICGVIAVVLGIVGIVKAGKLPANTGRGQAIAGLVTGAAAVLIFFLVTAAFVDAVNDCIEYYC